MTSPSNENKGEQTKCFTSLNLRYAKKNMALAERPLQELQNGVLRFFNLIKG